MKKQSKILIGIVAAVAVLAVIIALIVMTATGGNKDTYASHMELAQRYLDELQYEQAIAEYEAAIAIEPNRAEAYLALAEVYVEMKDYESAIGVLSEGIEWTGAEELAEYLEKVQEEVLAAREPEETPESQTAVEEAKETEEIVSEPWEETEYYDDGSYVVYEYDAQGNMIKKTYYNADGIIVFWVIYEYDAQGNRTKETVYNADGTISGVDEFN